MLETVWSPRKWYQQY